MHLKRQKAPRSWPLARKGTKYLVVPSSDVKSGLPLLIILREVLKLVKTRKEAKKIINLKKVKINGKLARDEGYPLKLFDILTLDDKNYQISSGKNKFLVTEIKDSEAGKKIVKVIDKKIIKKGKIQLNLIDGRNFLYNKEVKVGDSVILNFEKNDIEKVLPFKEGAKILFIGGKHRGGEGIVKEINEKTKIHTIEVDKEKINSKINSLMVIE